MWLLTRVDSHVAFTVPIVSELFTTKFARIGLLTGVAPHVDGKMITVNECFAADEAHVLRSPGVLVFNSVDAHVTAEDCFVRECFPTDFAGIWLLTCVGSHVDPTVPFACKPFPTYLARVRLLTSVASHVYN